MCMVIYKKINVSMQLQCLKYQAYFYNSFLSIDYSASEYKTRNKLKVILLPSFSLIIYVMQINFIIKKTTRQLMSV